MLRAVRLLAAVFVATVGFAACDGDDRLSQEEFESQLLAACQDVNQELEGVGEDTDAFADAIADLENGRMHGRGVLVP